MDCQPTALDGFLQYTTLFPSISCDQPGTEIARPWWDRCHQRDYLWATKSRLVFLLIVHKNTPIDEYAQTHNIRLQSMFNTAPCLVLNVINIPPWTNTWLGKTTATQRDQSPQATPNLNPNCFMIPLQNPSTAIFIPNIHDWIAFITLGTIDHRDDGNSTSCSRCALAALLSSKQEL